MITPAQLNKFILNNLLTPEQMLKRSFSLVCSIAKAAISCFTTFATLALNLARKPQVTLIVHPNSVARSPISSTPTSITPHYDPTGTRVIGVFYSYAHPNSLRGSL